MIPTINSHLKIRFDDLNADGKFESFRRELGCSANEAVVLIVNSSLNEGNWNTALIKVTRDRLVAELRRWMNQKIHKALAVVVDQFDEQLSDAIETAQQDHLAAAHGGV